MSIAELITKPQSESLITFPIQDAIIDALAEKYSALTIVGVNDRKGFEAVHAARMEMVRYRTSTEKTRKELNDAAQRHIKTVNAEAKRLTARMEPIESRLEQQENAVLAEKERIRLADEERKRAVLQSRVEALQAVGAVPNIATLGLMNEAEFASLLASATEAHRIKQAQEAAEEAERQRLIAEDQEQQRIEKEKIAAERAELARLRAEQESAAAERKRVEDERIAAENAKLAAARKAQEEEARQLAAERQRLADEEAERQRLADVERQKAEAAEKARIETEQRIAREAAEAKALADAEEAARLRELALRPDREKLLAVAGAIDAIKLPDVSPEMETARAEIQEVLTFAINRICRIVDSAK